MDTVGMVVSELMYGALHDNDQMVVPLKE